MELRHRAAKLIHLLPASHQSVVIARHGDAAAATQDDSSVEHSEALGGYPADAIETGVLATITAHQSAKRVDGVLDVGMGTAIWREKVVVAGQKKCALSGLGIDGAGEQLVGAFDDRVTALDLTDIRYDAPRSLIGESADQ
jgi:hypothetical protein